MKKYTLLNHRKYLLLWLLLSFSSVITIAQIDVTPTNPRNCNDGTVTIAVKNPSLNFEYAVDNSFFKDEPFFSNLSPGYHRAIVRDKNTKCSFAKNFTLEGLQVYISGAGSTTFCNNASGPPVTLKAIISGGSGNYSCSWSDCSLDVYSSGKYTVTVTDLKTGCSASRSAEVLVIPIVCAVDPNDIIGPTGYGAGKMVSKFQPQPYIIRFENDPAFATASAQVVKITHPLHPNANIFSLRLSDFGFGGMSFQVPENKTHYSTRLNVLDSLGVVVDVTAGIDVTKKEAFWIFESKDPKTGLAPTNATAGFLPVNDSSGKGEGFVSFTIKAAEHTKTADSIYAEAGIVFDLNAPVPTPVIFNTIDAVAPTSKVKDVPPTSDSTKIVLAWKGEDDVKGSGVRDYAVYVSENDGPFTMYQSSITDTTTTFTGSIGRKYSFFTLATDNTGNQESMKNSGEATVQLTGGTLPITWLYFRGKLQVKDVLLNWVTINEKNSKSFHIERSLDGRQFAQIGTVNASGNSNQTRNYLFNDQNAASINAKLLYYRLRQEDIDGKVTYSIVIAISISQTSAEPIVKAYPNPFTQTITLHIINVSPSEGRDKVELFTTEGRLLYQRRILNRGSATMLLDDLPNLSQGMYLLRTTLNGKLYTIKMIRE